MILEWVTDKSIKPKGGELVVVELANGHQCTATYEPNKKWGWSWILDIEFELCPAVMLQVIKWRKIK